MAKKRNLRLNISLPVEVAAYLDKMAKELSTTRSGMITQFVMFQKAMDENKSLNRLAEMMIKKALKK